MFYQPTILFQYSSYMIYHYIYLFDYHFQNYNKKYLFLCYIYILFFFHLIGFFWIENLSHDQNFPEK